MTDYECPKCHKVFKGKQGLMYHTKKNVCAQKTYSCDYCKSKFTSQNAKYRHIREACEEKKKRDIAESERKTYAKLEKLEKENERFRKYEKIKKLEQENAEFRRKIKKMQKAEMVNNGTINSDNSVTNNNTNIGAINNTNNVTIVAFQKEDLTHIDREDILKVLRTGFDSPRNLTEQMHFNPKYPHLSNIKRVNYNLRNKIMYYNGSEWVVSSDPHIIDTFYNRKRDFIEDAIEQYRDDLTEADMKKLNRWLAIDDDDDERIIKIKDSIRDSLYNKRHIAEQNEQKCIANAAAVGEESDIYSDEDIILTEDGILIAKN